MALTFDDLRDAPDDEGRARLLREHADDVLFPEVDPVQREEQFREIASWILSPSEWLREEVVMALCRGVQLPEFGWVAVEGWRRAYDDDLDVFGSCIIRQFKRPEEVTLDVVQAIAQRLWPPPPDMVNELTDTEEAQRSAVEVLAYFGDLLLPDVRELERKTEVPMGPWQKACWVLSHFLLKKRAGSP